MFSRITLFLQYFTLLLNTLLIHVNYTLLEISVPVTSNPHIRFWDGGFTLRVICKAGRQNHPRLDLQSPEN